MKRLFTFVALMACFLGAKAQQQWEKVYSIDYTTYSGFPFYVMGYVPEFDGNAMIDYGADYRYATQSDLDGDGDAKWKDGESSVGTAMAGSTEYQKVTGAGPYWHQYFIATQIPTVIDETYKVVAKVKASEDATINVDMRWSWSENALNNSVAIPQSDDFVEVEWEYSGIGGSSCDLIAQPGASAATIEWQSLVVYHKLKANQRPKEWIEAITFNGDAESAWPDWSLEATDGINANWRGDRTGEICAWALTMGRNFDDQNTLISEESPRARPFPADIVVDPADENNHVFVVDVTQIAAIDAPTPDESSVAWSNQFWIQSPQGWKSGTQIKLKFRYKAEHACSAGTQIHKQHPSDYLHWEAVGDVAFTESWQTFDKTITFSDAQGGGWSLAFNLCSDATNGRSPNKFYFDDFSWQYLKLDDGYFISGINTATTTSYDNLDNAVEFVYDDEAGLWIAEFGEKGNKDSYVDQIMISTVRGDDAAFKGATLKPESKITNDPDDWQEFTASTNAKLDLPGLGVWKVYLDTDYNAMAFEMLEGEEFEQPDPVDIVTNTTNVVVKGQEREPTATEQPADEEAGIAAGTGQAWDNQFFIIANRVLNPGEATIVKFKYKASVDGATSGTQSHGNPGGYIHWAAIGNITFGEDWQDFEYDFTIPAECDGTEGKQFKSIAFNLAEIKEACDYEFKDFQWYLVDTTLEEGKTYENLIDAEGTKNFYVKEGAGTDPYEFGTDPSGISTVVVNNNANNVIYNIAGQRVNKAFKGIVVKNGNKYVVK